MAEFADVLRRLRQEAGHASTRSFYQAGGGIRKFGCGYKQYLNIENGRSIPGPALFRKLFSALELETDRTDARSLAEAYLHSLLGKEPGLADLLIRILSREDAARGALSPLLRKAVKRGFSCRRQPLTSAQTELIRSDAVHFWLFTLLSNDRGAWTPEELSRTARRPLSKVIRALEELRKHGLLSRDTRSRYSCPWAGRILIFAEERPGRRFGIQDLDAEFKETASRHGETIFQRSLFTRSSAADMTEYLSILTDALQSADAYTRQAGGEDTAFFLVEGSVRKVLPF